MPTIMKKVVELPDEYLLPLLLVTAVVFLAIPWAVARFRGWSARRGPLAEDAVQTAIGKRMPKSSVWAALGAAVLAFPCLLVVAGLCAWPMVGSLPGMPWGLTDEGVFNLCALVLVVPVSLITGMIYMYVRWGSARTATDIEDTNASC